MDEDKTRPERIDPFRNPGGSFDRAKLTRYGLLGIGGLLLLGLLVYNGKKPTDPTQSAPVAAIPTPPPGANRSTGADEQRALGRDQENRVVNGPSPEEQRRQAMRDMRRDLEAKAAFASSAVAPDRTNPQMPQSPLQVPQAAPSQQVPVVPVAAKAEDLLAFSQNQQLYVLPEHTVIPAVMTSRIEGEMSGPVDAQVSMDIYLPNTHKIIIPRGAKLLGEAKAVNATGQERIAVPFHRCLVYPPGASQPYAIPLDVNTPGLDQAGGAGLHDKVNNHFLQIFGASAAIGLISGLSELGSYNATYSPEYGFYNGLSTSTSQNAMRVLDRFLNRFPTLVIREGTRINVELINDIRVPEYPTEAQ